MIITNHGRRKKKEGDEDDEYMSHRVSYKDFSLNQYIPELWGFFKNVGGLWRMSDSVKN